jgi:hypothetical protein
MSAMTTGYQHAAYANSLSEFGVPFGLDQCKGWALVRKIPGCDFHDAIGSYPLFACHDWSQLRVDLEGLVGRLVSIAVVTDPFGEYDVTLLKSCFQDVVMPFKQHFITDLTRPVVAFVHPHHRRYAQKALSELTVQKCEDDDVMRYLDDWNSLYKVLIERHQVTGIRAFSRESFTKQLAVPGLVAFRAVCDEITVGMLLWYVHGDVAYYHLGAFSDYGYKTHASFALFWRAIEHFAAGGYRWLDLGAGVGTNGGSNDGLTRFKEGWSTGTRTAYFCGRILDRAIYNELGREKADTSYFPAYRMGEFA